MPVQQLSIILYNTSLHVIFISKIPCKKEKMITIQLINHPLHLIYTYSLNRCKLLLKYEQLLVSVAVASASKKKITFKAKPKVKCR